MAVALVLFYALDIFVRTLSHICTFGSNGFEALFIQCMSSQMKDHSLARDVL
jgi:hypothetical protein